MKRYLKESKANAELAVIKCIAGTQLSPDDIAIVSSLSENDLMQNHGCDIFMVEQVKLHVKQEAQRMRSQYGV